MNLNQPNTYQSTRNHLSWLIPLIAILTATAALAGLWPGEGESFSAVTIRGEEVRIQGSGLYYWDTVSSAAQMQANDLTALVLGLPLLLGSFWFTKKGSLKARLLLAGTLGFILYTYITMAVGAHYNDLFLVYVGLFSLSLIGFILVIMTIHPEELARRITPKFPRRSISGLLFFAAGFLSLAWLGRIAETWTSNSPPHLENITSMFIQAMDLALVVPLCAIAGVLVLQRRPWGYVLASVGLMKFLTMGVAVSLMGFNMARVGAPVSPVELVVFPAITLANLLLVTRLISSIDSSYSLTNHPSTKEL